jgi:hypothetical protein
MIGAVIDTMSDKEWRQTVRGTTWRDYLKAAVGEYRTSRSARQREDDVAAIAFALSKLSDRRLTLLGIRRDGLVHAVETLVEKAEEARSSADEIICLIDGTRQAKTQDKTQDTAGVDGRRMNGHSGPGKARREARVA